MGSENNGKFTPALLASAVVAALGGLLFGFDTAVIAGVSKALKEIYSLGDMGEGFTVSVALLGTMAGALAASVPSDKWGRRDSLKLTGFLFLVSALGCASAWNWHSMLFFRFVGGLGIGAASVIAPMYIAEISPAKSRGLLVATFQWNIVAGILLAYLSNWIISSLGFDPLGAEWRLKLGIEAVPALVFFALLFFIPRSAYWLLKAGRRAEAEESLRKISPESVAETVAEIEESIENSRRLGNPPLLCRKFAYPIFLAVSIAFFNQFSGINAVLYYINGIFEDAGFDGNMPAVMVGLANFVFTIIAMSMIDRLGRKTLLLAGAFGTSAMLLAAALILKTQAHQEFLAAALCVYIAFFAMSQGAVIWVYISEIFPVSVRAKGLSLGASAHWIFCYIVAQLFPKMSGLEGADFGFESVRLNGSFPFFLFFATTLLQIAAVRIFYPETKGIPLETVQKSFKNPFAKKSPPQNF